MILFGSGSHRIPYPVFRSILQIAEGGCLPTALRFLQVIATGANAPSEFGNHPYGMYDPRQVT
jgi:hypothetical protein